MDGLILSRYPPGMASSPVKDLCRSTDRHRGQTKVCQREIHHQGDHDDLTGYTWPQEAQPPSGPERVFVL